MLDKHIKLAIMSSSLFKALGDLSKLNERELLILRENLRLYKIADEKLSAMIDRLVSRVESYMPSINSSIQLDSSLNYLILSGGCLFGGTVAIIIAFTLLNAATLGTAGVVVATIGAGLMLAGIGIFAKNCSKNQDTSLELNEPSELWNLRLMS